MTGVQTCALPICRSYVLQQMHKHGYITATDLGRAEATALPTQGHDDVRATGPYYLEWVRRFVLTKVDRDKARSRVKS